MEDEVDVRMEKSLFKKYWNELLLLVTAGRGPLICAMDTIVPVLVLFWFRHMPKQRD
jgi:hypothetical protein